MGIYVFASKHGPFVKVGHYKGQNAWSRIAHRGFRSCVCPKELKEQVMVDDMELVAWFPSLTTKWERVVKQVFRPYVGEWYHDKQKTGIVNFLSLQEENQAKSCCKVAACAVKQRL